MNLPFFGSSLPIKAPLGDAVDGVRLLLVLVHQGLRLHRSAKKFKHRIGASCVEMSAEDQRRAEEEHSGYDWSAEPSLHTLDEVSEAAVERVRQYLRATDEESRVELAGCSTPELLRRLGVLGPASAASSQLPGS